MVPFGTQVARGWAGSVAEAHAAGALVVKATSPGVFFKFSFLARYPTPHPSSSSSSSLVSLQVPPRTLGFGLQGRRHRGATPPRNPRPGTGKLIPSPSCFSRATKRASRIGPCIWKLTGFTPHDTFFSLTTLRTATDHESGNASTHGQSVSGGIFSPLGIQSVEPKPWQQITNPATAPDFTASKDLLQVNKPDPRQ